MCGSAQHPEHFPDRRGGQVATSSPTQAAKLPSALQGSEGQSFLGKQRLPFWGQDISSGFWAWAPPGSVGPPPSPGELPSIPCRPTGQRASPGPPQASCRDLAEGRVTEAGPGPDRILGRTRERLGDFSPEIQTIGQSVLDRFRSSEVKKKIRKYSVKAIFSPSRLGGR